METKLLLLKAISLAYYKSHLDKDHTTSTDLLLEQIIDHIEFPDDNSGFSNERGPLMKLRGLLLWMIRNTSTTKYDVNDLLSRIRVAVGDNDRLYELFIQAILHTDVEGAGVKVASISGELTQYIAVEEFTVTLRDASRRLAFQRGSIDDLAKWRADLMGKIEALPIEGRRAISTTTRIINLSDVDSVADIFESAQLRVDPESILKFPYKGLNDFTGPQQGLLLGDWSVHCALPGQNKTGILIDTFCGWCVLNKPVVRVKGKKPTLVYVTIEDPIETTMQKIYTILRQVETGLPAKVVGIPFKEMAEYVNTVATKNGWEVFVMQFANGGHSEEYLQIFRDLEDDGYQVSAVACDYVNLIGKAGIPAVTAGDEIKYLHRKLRGYFNSKLILHATVHQLGPKAKELFRLDPLDYIRKLPNQGSFEGCTSLDTEPDFIFYAAKTQHGRGQWWQQFQFDKHRRIGTLPDHLKYFASKFQAYPMMNCKWDIDDERSGSYDRVGSNKPKPLANWDTLSELNAGGGGDVGEGVEDYGF